jgi:DNA replication protein DnaC
LTRSSVKLGTSQLPVTTWHEVIGEATLGDAILDHIAYNAYRLELDGPSMRKLKASQEIESSVQPVATVAADGKSSKGAKK